MQARVKLNEFYFLKGTDRVLVWEAAMLGEGLMGG